MTYSDEFKKAWEEYSGCDWGCNVNDSIVDFVAFKAGWDACLAAQKEQKDREFYCVVDGDVDPYPDCVIQTNNHKDCAYANSLTSPEQCRYWREVKP